MADYKFYALFTANKVGKTGITVTIDVYKSADDSLVVNNAAVNEIAGGLYSYVYQTASADDYVAIFKTADTTVDQRHVPALATKETINASQTGEYTAAIAAVQADLDNPDQYKADVSTLATTAHVQEVEDKVDIVDGIADAILDDTGTSGVLLSTSALRSIFDDEVIVGTYTFSDLLKIIAAKIAGKATGGGTTTITYRGVDDSSDVIVETVDANGNRSAMTLTV